MWASAASESRGRAGCTRSRAKRAQNGRALRRAGKAVAYLCKNAEKPRALEIFVRLSILFCLNKAKGTVGMGAPCFPTHVGMMAAFSWSRTAGKEGIFRKGTTEETASLPIARS